MTSSGRKSGDSAPCGGGGGDVTIPGRVRRYDVTIPPGLTSSKMMTSSSKNSIRPHNYRFGWLNLVIVLKIEKMTSSRRKGVGAQGVSDVTIAQGLRSSGIMTSKSKNRIGISLGWFTLS